uniref:SMB domain-containing protein n=1 Tax=Pectinophora gossypiella TaxID=13191 RepID=A0A1E1WH51_PECGO
MAVMRVVLLFAVLSQVAAYHGPDLPPGPYCGLGGTRGGCCTNRQDSCSHKILDTLCYCDEFCNKTRVVDDCCPDYEEVCLGLLPPSPAERGVCILGQKKMNKCNKCTCDIVDNRPDWICEYDVCMISDDVIYGVNQGGETWRAANYTKYLDKKLKDGLVYRLGTLPLDRDTRRMGAIQYNEDIEYPRNFDARKHWPRFISPIMDQGWCGSDWAVSIASIASDRFAIQSNGAESMVLSPQSLLSCNVRGQRGCDGGHIDVAWNFAGQYGLVDLDCYPYKAAVKPCPYRITGNLLETGCTPRIPTRTSKYKVSPPYRIVREKDIMWEIMESGPVQAVMTVYQDFFHYRDGIYRHTRHGNLIESGLHSVKIIGWGEERGDRYWTVANSWGQEWGEDGYFRIARGTDESGIESFVIAGLSDVSEANQWK